MIALRRAPALALFVVLAVSCAPRLAKLPSGPGVVAADIAAVMVQVMSSCNDASSMTAEIAVSGSVAGRRLRAHLLGGFMASSTRLEAVSPAGPPFFIFVATGRDATLLLPRDDRVLEHGSAADVFEAISGARIEPSELLRILTACSMPDLSSAVAIGDRWRVASGARGAKLYLYRDSTSAPWHVATLLYPGEGLRWSWRADYSDFHNGHPSTIHLVSAESGRFDLTLVLSQVALRVNLGPDVFRVHVPSSARPITVDELRRNGPLGS